MTSDGISDGDWAVVQKYAFEIAAATDGNEDLRSQPVTAALLKYLDVLERKYGALPSILATRADYVSDSATRVQLLQQAYQRAVCSGDRLNSMLAASSLAEFFIDEEPEIASAQRWLAAFAERLGDHWDDSEHEIWRGLASRLDQLKGGKA